MRHRSLFVLSLVLLCVASAGPRLHAQNGQTVDKGTVTKDSPVEERPDPLKRRLSDHEEAQRRKAIRNELSPEDKKWLNEDVRAIDSDGNQGQFARVQKSLHGAFWKVCRRSEWRHGGHSCSVKALSYALVTELDGLDLRIYKKQDLVPADVRVSRRRIVQFGCSLTSCCVGHCQWCRPPAASVR